MWVWVWVWVWAGKVKVRVGAGLGLGYQGVDVGVGSGYSDTRVAVRVSIVPMEVSSRRTSRAASSAWLINASVRCKMVDPWTGFPAAASEARLVIMGPI